jgi:gliding motility-associated-like protein
MGKQMWSAKAGLIALFAFFGLLWHNDVPAQAVVISSYFNASAPSEEWIELLVIEDDLDLNGFTLRDNTNSQSSWQEPVTFIGDIWGHLRTGTVIIVWNRMHAASGQIHPLDTIGNDGYLEVHASDTSYFSGGNFIFSLSIGGTGEIVQLRDAAGNHVHALGHSVSPGPDWIALPLPKLNHAQSLVSGEAVSVCPGPGLSEYGSLSPQNGATFTCKSNNLLTRGLPNRSPADSALNSDYWRSLRQPSWPSPGLALTFSSPVINLNWNAVADLFPDDSTQGYLILRNDSSSFTAPVDGHTYNTGDFIGNALVIAEVPSSQTLFYTDTYALNCGDTLYYRVYASRYDTDGPNGNDYNAARGRAYNESDFGAASVIIPMLEDPISSMVDRNDLCSDDEGYIILTVNGGNGDEAEWFSGACNGTFLCTGITLMLPSPEDTTTYYVHWTSSLCGNTGCVSVTVNVTDPPDVSDAGPDQALCGAVSTVLAGNQPSSGLGRWSLVVGPGNSTFTDITAFNSQVIVTVYGLYGYRWAISTSDACPESADTVFVNFGTAVAVVAGSNSPLCAGNDIVLTSSIPGASYSWSGPNGFTSPEQNPVINNALMSNAGTYTVVVTGIPGGCPDTQDETDVIIYQSVAEPAFVTVSPETICEGYSGEIMLSAGGGAGNTLEWYTGSCGGTLIGTGTSIAIRAPSLTTEYFARWTSANCGHSSCKSIILTVEQAPTMAYAGEDQAVCSLLATTMSANEPLVGSGRWTTISGPGSVSFTDPLSPTTSISVSLMGSYLLRWSISSGGNCAPGSDEVSVAFSDNVVLTAGSNSPVCEGDSIMLFSSFSGATYLWSGPGGFTSTEQNPLILNADIACTGNYTVMVSNIPGGCPPTNAYATVAVISLPVAPPINSMNITGSVQEICVGSVMNYYVSDPAPGSTYAWELSGGGLIHSFSSSDIIDIEWYATAGSYDLSVSETNAAGCSGIPGHLTVIMVHNSAPSIIIRTDNDTICAGSNIHFTADVSSAGADPIYQWKKNGSKVGANDSVYFLETPADNDQVTCEVSSANFCADPASAISNQIYITVEQCLTEFFLTMPNAFTPNADGINDRFLPVFTGPENIILFETHIYNRWGQLLFTSNEIGEGWDGSFNSKPCASDVYAYLIKCVITGDKAGVKEISGRVILIR